MALECDGASCLGAKNITACANGRGQLRLKEGEVVYIKAELKCELKASLCRGA